MFKSRHHNGLKKRLISLSFISVLISGCSLSPFITEDSVDYNRTVEDVTLNVLATNILRARDRAPLFFSDLSQIRGNIALNLSTQQSFPFGPLNAGTVRNSLQTGPLAINSTPGFDIAPLNTKQFYLGILNPINPNVVGYYLERGLPGKEMLNLLVARVSEYRMTSDGPRAVNATSDHPGLSKIFETWNPRPFLAGGRRWQPLVRKARQQKAFGPPVRGSLGDIVKAAGEDKIEIKSTGSAAQVYKNEENPVLCVPDANGYYFAVGIARNSIIDGPSDTQIPKDNSACRSLGAGPAASVGNDSSRRYVISIRSVEQVFYYLGEQLQKPINDREVPFALEEGDAAGARFSIRYRGRLYHVNETAAHDDTISILAVLTGLLNINRDATEIPTTKTVATTH